LKFEVRSATGFWLGKNKTPPDPAGLLSVCLSDESYAQLHRPAMWQ